MQFKILKASVAGSDF